MRIECNPFGSEPTHPFALRKYLEEQHPLLEECFCSRCCSKRVALLEKKANPGKQCNEV